MRARRARLRHVGAPGVPAWVLWINSSVSRLDRASAADRAQNWDADSELTEQSRIAMLPTTIFLSVIIGRDGLIDQGSPCVHRVKHWREHNCHQEIEDHGIEGGVARERIAA